MAKTTRTASAPSVPTLPGDTLASVKVGNSMLSTDRPTADRDIVRETVQFDYWGKLWDGTKTVENFTSFGPNATALDAAVQTCWGAFGTVKYDRPFNGADVPAQYQIRMVPGTADKPSKASTGRTSETISEDGQKSIDYLVTLPGWQDARLTADYSYTYQNITYNFALGTRVGDRQGKALARLIWAVRCSLPRVLKGKQRDKYIVACHRLVGLPDDYTSGNGATVVNGATVIES